MNGDISLGAALSKIFWYVGEIGFKLVPGTVASLFGTDSSSGVAIPAGITPITEPVTTASIVSFLEKTSSPEQFSSFVHNWNVFVAISMSITFVLATGMIYCFVRIRQVRHFERLKFQAAEHTVVAKDIPKTQLRWNRILEQVDSGNQQSWRLAILEADIMLNELLDLRGYKGDTISDKMKQVDRVNFNTIDQAWEAHRIRNRIAHEGSNMKLDESEVRRTIGLYMRVFKESEIIQ